MVHSSFFRFCYMYQSNEIGELAAALAAAQSGFTFAVTDATGGMKNKYATLQNVLEAIRQGLTANGIAVIQAPMPSQNGIMLRTTLAHKSGQWMASEISLPNDRMGGIQGMGSALTYARRYALAAMVGIAQDDDDGATAMKESQEQARAKAKTENPNPMTAAQSNALMAYLTKRHGKNREAGLSELSRFFGRSLASSRELTKADVSEFLNAINGGQNG